MQLKPAHTEIEFQTGQKAALALNFPAMYALRAKNKEQYAKLNSVLIHGTKDILDSCTILYGAYLCANLDTPKAELLSELEFMQLLPEDVGGLSQMAAELITPKKQTASGAPSNGVPAEGAKE